MMQYSGSLVPSSQTVYVGFSSSPSPLAVMVGSTDVGGGGELEDLMNLGGG